MTAATATKTAHRKERPFPLHASDKFYEASSWQEGMKKYETAQRAPLEGAAVRILRGNFPHCAPH